jgi:GT2 family glycosyltransferase
MAKPLVSIVIVNYNSRDYLPACLDSIAVQTYPNREVIVFDNASKDQSVRHAQERSWVKVIQSGQNLGFAGGQNSGLVMAAGDYLMPLNFDFQMTPTFLEKMVAALESSSQVGSVAGKLYQIDSQGKRAQNLYAVGHHFPADRFSFIRGDGQVDQGQFDASALVFGSPGCAPLYRRAMLEDTRYRNGFFDEALFTWYEDVDLDWRAQQLGWDCLYTPEAIAYHAGHPEGHRGNLWQICMTIRNRWLIVQANEDEVLARRDRQAILKYELGLLWYVIRDGYFSAYRQARQQYRQMKTGALQKRAWIHAHPHFRPTHKLPVFDRLT